ncbi:TetR/AcrR family transcriptional regulator [Microlunatus capsulatus]|uniref:AcrR family transcriptional regulator n=1 Tax=Microlunatus capsulatus TaxID=99117 RepID=A0ABS4Z4C1_9ACTN|nr:TetR/AcrR family transcriptional regulator [Microlunatus capsulatus]MBP2415093.1 AcrR family transcriptional regulator [Microlunatus capsulatus]
MSDLETPARRTRNPRGEGDRLRSEIVAAATVLLQEGSAAAVTLRAVARGAGITAPAIYRHFPDVDAILRAVVDTAFADLERRLRAAQESREDPVGRLRAVSRGYLDFARQQPEHYRLMFGGAWDASAGADDVQRADRASIGMDAFQVLVDVVAGCVEAGASAGDDAFADASALWVGLHGLAGLRQTTPLFPWPRGLEDDLVTTLTRLIPAGERTASSRRP